MQLHFPFCSCIDLHYSILFHELPHAPKLPYYFSYGKHIIVICCMNYLQYQTTYMVRIYTLYGFLKCDRYYSEVTKLLIINYLAIMHTVLHCPRLVSMVFICLSILCPL